MCQPCYPATVSNINMQFDIKCGYMHFVFVLVI